jgi:hypothetical protein
LAASRGLKAGLQIELVEAELLGFFVCARAIRAEGVDGAYVLKSFHVRVGRRKVTANSWISTV